MKWIFSIFPALLSGFLFLNNDASQIGKDRIHIAGNYIVEETYDGPYVFYKNDSIFIKYIKSNDGAITLNGDSTPLSAKNNVLLKVSTDDPGKTFDVKLKEKLKNEKAEYSKVQKILALSDIEGNFGALRKLLQGNGVIDSGFNWIFGKGHLVLGGDFFDRGDQVTEVLWFIYSLEEKAIAAGGYVHFILGNHEIMNLSNDLRYLNSKYLNSATLMNSKYQSLYDDQTELGRWLRTKNVVEKIGSTLFMHAGISAEINRLGIPVSEINKSARPWYADTTYEYKDLQTEYIMGDTGPFWYRGYYTGTRRITYQQIDSTLTNFNVKHIVTGHTIVADTISVWYDGRVLNTDVHHAEGKSEALLIEENKFYRVNNQGNKTPLL
ncbi:MAG: metallophosphoesterase [Bacteroidota bacterium]